LNEFPHGSFHPVALLEVLRAAHFADQIREPESLRERFYDMDEDRPFVFQVFGSVRCCLRLIMHGS